MHYPSVRKGRFKNPVGMYVDARENIFVCSKKTGNVTVITFDGRKYESLLSYKDALKFPHAISFRGIDNTLLVSCSDSRSNKLFFFKLAYMIYTRHTRMYM